MKFQHRPKQNSWITDKNLSFKMSWYFEESLVQSMHTILPVLDVDPQIILLSMPCLFIGIILRSRQKYHLLFLSKSSILVSSYQTTFRHNVCSLFQYACASLIRACLCYLVRSVIFWHSAKKIGIVQVSSKCRCIIIESDICQRWLKNGKGHSRISKNLLN